MKGYGKKAKPGTFEPEYVVLHRTAGASKLDPIRAHFEVDIDGKIYKANPIDKQVPHLLSNKDKTVGDSNAIGIEYVGLPHTIANRPATAKDRAKVALLRAEVAALQLPPKFRQRMQSMSDADLITTLRASGWFIYRRTAPENLRTSVGG